MDYIVLDIEFNGRKFASPLPMEVIEIGAVRLNEQFEYIDSFTSFVKPVYFAKLNSFIQKKTGIPQEAIDQAARFPAVIKKFMAWLQKSENPLLITWGGEDMKRIILDTRMHKLDDTFFMQLPYFDLLKGYIHSRGLTNDVSVEGALEQLQIETSEQAHRALDDAKMTAKILIAVHKEVDWEKVTHYVDTYTNAKERRALKNAVRLLRASKKEATWENYVERFIKDKIDEIEQNKLLEMKNYFELIASKLQTTNNEQEPKDSAS